jgi:hypothetical protein
MFRLWIDRIAPEWMAAVLRAPDQLCYFVFFELIKLLYIFSFVHVSAIVSKELLDIKTAITNLNLDEDFYLNKSEVDIILRPGPNPRHLEEAEAALQRLTCRVFNATPCG